MISRTFFAVLMTLGMTLSMPGMADNVESTSLSENQAENKNTLKYRRVIGLSKDAVWNTNAPLPLDANHQKMIQSGFYTQADADELTDNALLDVITKYGPEFDFTTASYKVDISATSGLRTLYQTDANGNLIYDQNGNRIAKARFFPAVFGIDYEYVVTFDTANIERGPSQKWYALDYGQMLVFATNGVFESGVYAGKQYHLNDFYVIGEVNLLKRGSTNKREVIPYNTTHLTVASVNQNGDRQFNVVKDVWDENGRQGLWMASTAIILNPLTQVKQVEEHVTVTWHYENN